MRREGVPDAAIANFRHYYAQLVAGESGMLPDADLEPVPDVPDARELPDAEAPMDKAVVLKLNGGLGTSMGMTRAKSLIEAPDQVFDLLIEEDGRAAVGWNGNVLARLAAGRSLLEPALRTSRALDQLSAARRAELRARLEAWVDAQIDLEQQGDH